jgi:hypothetical protein
MRRGGGGVACTLTYPSAASLCASVTERPMVEMVVKAYANVLATSKKARSHFSGAIC